MNPVHHGMVPDFWPINSTILKIGTIFNRYKQNDLFERTYTFLPKYTWYHMILRYLRRNVYIHKITFPQKSIIFGMKGTNKFRLQKKQRRLSCCSNVRWRVQIQSYPIASALEVRLMNGWYLIGNVQKTPWIPSWLLEISRLWRNESNMHNVSRPWSYIRCNAGWFNGNLPNGLVSNPI